MLGQRGTSVFAERDPATVVVWVQLDSVDGAGGVSDGAAKCDGEGGVSTSLNGERRCNVDGLTS